jgi:hypothetical protein
MLSSLHLFAGVSHFVQICYIFRQHVLLNLRYSVKEKLNGLHTSGSGKRSYSSLVHGSSPLSLAGSSLVGQIGPACIYSAMTVQM